MGEISEAAKAKACELANEACRPYRGGGCLDYKPHNVAPAMPLLYALAEQAQAVSDAAKAADKELALGFGAEDEPRAAIAPFILPEPPDPLRAAIDTIQDDSRAWLPSSAGSEFESTKDQFVAALRAELAKRRLEIRPVQS